MIAGCVAAGFAFFQAANAAVRSPVSGDCETGRSAGVEAEGRRRRSAGGARGRRWRGRSMGGARSPSARSRARRSSGQQGAEADGRGPGAGCCCRAARPEASRLCSLASSLSTRPHSLPSRIALHRIGFLRSDPPLPSPADATPSSPVQVTFTTHSNPSSSDPRGSEGLPPNPWWMISFASVN